MHTKLIKVISECNNYNLDLLAEIDDKGKVINMYGYNQNQLKMSGNKVVYNNKVWIVPSRVDVKKY